MGIMRAAVESIKGNIADQWLEVIEPDEMDGNTVFTKGVTVRQNDKRNQNRKGTDDVIANGSVVHVYPNQLMLLVDGGKIVDYTAEEGYYVVDFSTAPSVFNGQLEDVVRESFERFKFGGVTPSKQKVYYVNLQEIKGIKFGTRTPINYFDNFYNAELFLRAHGTYSIKIVDPLRFYVEAIPKNRERVTIQDINEQYFSEFMEALRGAINQLSADGTRISFVSSKGRELSKHMADILDEEWKNTRGIEIQSVGIASISYDDESQKLINLRNKGAMLGDPTIREGYMQGAMARGVEAAGSNAAGAMTGFMGVGMGMQTGAGAAGAFSQANQQQIHEQKVLEKQRQNENSWTCECGTSNSGRFCGECGKPKPEEDNWTCECGTKNSGRFCGECGKPRPEQNQPKRFCSNCGSEIAINGKFCSECGQAQ